jgi:hypothetical protein
MKLGYLERDGKLKIADSGGKMQRELYEVRNRTVKNKIRA